MSAPKKFRGYAFTVEDWLAICEMHNHRCASCGEEKPLTVDHIKPRRAGGTDDIDNIQPLCRECNSAKSAKHDGVNLKRSRPVVRTGMLFVRLSAEDEAYLSLLMARTGVGKTAVIIQGIRALAAFHKITPKDIKEALTKPTAKPTDTEEG